MRLARHAAALALFLVAFAASGQTLIPSWRLSEMQPDVPNGGRADSIAVHPTNNDLMIVASESGGLFRSTDRGVTWTHIETFPTFWTRGMVTFLNDDPDVVIATAAADFQTANGGGIYRSPDAGLTWTQAPVPPAPPSNPGRLFEAREISVAPDNGNIYVATSDGVAISIDKGLSWSHVDPFGSNGLVQSVLALTTGVVLAGGPNGLRRSADHGMNWGTPATNGGDPFHDGNTHAFTRSPIWPGQAYMINGNYQVFRTEDFGERWTQIAGLPRPSGPCGGIAFVKARVIPATSTTVRQLVLWVGNTCSLYTLNCPETTGRSFDFTGSWQPKTVDHEDMRDLAFDGAGRPLLLATDGGLHSTSDGGNSWTFIGGGRCGYNALQVTEAKGQAVTGSYRHDLYFATQDNSLWSSPNDGRTWSRRIEAEGFYIEAEPKVRSDAESTLTAVACWRCVNKVTDSLFTNVRNWPDPPFVAPETDVAGNPAMIGRSLHTQSVKTNGSFNAGFAIKSGFGSWQQYATFPETPLSMPKLSNPAGTPVQYQSIRNSMNASGIGIEKLLRVVFTGVGQPPIVTYPQMNNFGGFAITPTVFAWYQVFGVDQMDTQHLIAPDPFSNKMMETWDAGDNWTEIPALTALVTDNGRYFFARRKDDRMHSNASTISFNRDNPDFIAVGTMQGGILLSMDRGRTWSRVPGSERATFITSIEWKSIGEAVVSTYGRGLWRLTLQWLLPLAGYQPHCNGLCVYVPFTPLVPDPPITVVLVFNGQIQGGTSSNGTLQELVVTPASSVVIYTDNVASVSQLKVTESSKAVGWTGVTPPKPSDGQELVGVSLNKSARLINGVFTTEPLVFYKPTEKERTQDKSPIGNPKSPTAGKPYLTLNLTPANRVLPSESLRITGRDFAPSTTVEFTLDDKSVTKVKTSDKGALSVTIAAPARQGSHTVKVLDANRKLIDGATFLVVHKDESD